MKISRSFYIKILVITCLIGLSSLAMKPIQNALGGAITSIRTNLIERLETNTGMEIRYSSIRPSFFNSFDIRNLRFYKGESEVLTISRARFYFSLRELFKRNFVIHTVQVDRPVFRIDMDRDRETIDFFKSLSNPGNSGDLLNQITAFLPEKADYRIRNILISFTNGKTLFQADNMFINIRENKKNIFLDAKLSFEINYPGFFNRTVILKSDIGVNGVYLTELKEARADIFISFLNLSQQDVTKRNESFFRLASAGLSGGRNLLTMYPLNMNFLYKDNILSLKSCVETTALEFSLFYYPETEKISSRINLNNFLSGSMFHLSDDIRNIVYLNMETTGNLFLEYKTGESINYNINLHSGIINRRFLNDNSLSDAFLVNIAGNGKSAEINDFWINSSASSAKKGFFQGIINYKGNIEYSPFRPQGTVTVEHFSLIDNEDGISGIFNLSSSGRNIHVSGGRIKSGLFLLDSLDLHFYPSDSYYSLVASGLTKDKGSIFFDAVINKNPSQLEATLTLDSFSVFNLSEAIRPFARFFYFPSVSRQFVQNTMINTEIFISSDFKNIAYNAPNIVFKDEKTISVFSLSGTDHFFNLDKAVVYIGENELVFTANASFPRLSDINFNVNANFLDVSWNIEGQVLDRTTLIIRDPNGLHVYGGISNSGAVSGYIEGVNFPVPANQYPVYMDFYLTLRFFSADLWSLDINHFRFMDLYSDNGSVNFSVSGAADQNGAHFRNIVYSDRISSLAGTADFSWDTDFSYIQTKINVTDGQRRGEDYNLSGSLKDNQIDINASVNDMRIDRFFKGNGVMLASGTAEISWNSLDLFKSKINLESFRTMNHGNAINASGEMLFSNDDLLLNNLNFEYSGVRAYFPVFMISPSEGQAKINAAFDGYAGLKKLGGSVKLDANFGRIESWLNIRNVFKSFKGTLNIDNFQFGNVLEEKTAFIFSGDEKKISVSGGVRNMLRLEMDRDGNFFTSLSSPLPVRGSFAGVYKDGHFDASCNDFYIDLASLWDLASNPNENFIINGGYVTGRMNLRGPVWNPEFYGTARGTSISIQVPNYIKEDIKPVPFNVVAEGYEMKFGPVVAASGSGAGIVNGWLRFEYWVPRNVGLDINVARTSPVPYGINIAGFHSKGETSGKLELELNSNDKIMEISGDLFVNNTEMGIVTDEFSESPDDFDDKKFNAVVDIKITTGPMVEFFWPNITSPILRANPEMGTVLTVQSDTGSGQYSLNSDIRIRTGELYYLDRVFYVRQGNLVLRENETHFNPRLSARAEIRDRSNTGPVTISMIIDNQPLLNFVPRFESSPSLTQLEIYSILGQNLNNIENNTDMAQRFLLASSTDVMAHLAANSDVFSQMLSLRQFERTLRNFLKLDMLSIRTRFFQNAVISGASEMGLGMGSIDRNNRVGNYFDNTTVFIGKYVGHDMFVQGTFTLKFDENRLDFGGLKFEPDIGIELQSPFFNIRWAFFPYSPENWWVNDHSISLIWNKSY